MPAGFKKHRSGDAGTAKEVKGDGSPKGSGPSRFDGRKNMQAGKTVKGSERDFSERIYKYRNG